MGRTYEQLCLKERCSIARLHEGWRSQRQIVAALDRSPSTIARETRRNAFVVRGRGCGAGLWTALQSVTFDNGAEFTHHHQLGSSLNIRTYFCDRHARWQKGGIENAIGWLSRARPRTTDPEQIPPRDIQRLTGQYNNTPTKCLDYQTPRVKSR